MSERKIGIWFIGAWGGVATTSVVGLAALQKGIAPLTGLVSELPLFRDVPLAKWNQFVVGGHEIRQIGYQNAARELVEKSNLFSAEMLTTIAPVLDEFDANIKQGTLLNVGSIIEKISCEQARKQQGETAATALKRIQHDIENFRAEHQLEQVVVVNLASTEPAMDLTDLPDSWPELNALLQKSKTPPLPASSLYAIAAFEAGCPFINFTPSIAADLPAIIELAASKKVVHCGRDGKTGETLLKSVLAPMFAARNLQVLSWVGHNIFGNMDGIVLNAPENKATKVHSKAHLLSEILGYDLQSLVSIEYIESLGDWKTAWDHIHFEGFLNTKMTLQLTWQGCDSILAAPLVLDLIRLCEIEQRLGNSGIQEHLACFFKSPMGTTTPEFALQYEQLKKRIEQIKIICPK